MAAIMKAEENNNHLKVFLPSKLTESLPKCVALPKERQRWNTNDEIASYLTNFEKHEEWLSCSPRTRPQNGSIILYNRKKVKYRKDGYCWKKRKDGKTTREDHMKLKVQGMECLYGCYVHSSILPTFHRRCYWLLQNPDIVLVHYLNVPAPEDGARGPVTADRREWLKWSKEELLCQLTPMFHCIKWPCGEGGGEVSVSVEQLVQQVVESQQCRPQPRTHTCLCNGALGSVAGVPHRCITTRHRIISPKLECRHVAGAALTEVQNLAVPEGGGCPSRRSSRPPPSTARPPEPDPAPDEATPPIAPLLAPGEGEPGSSLTPSQQLAARRPLPPAPPSPPAPPPTLPTPFDPDSFLNCPRQGETYGGGGAGGGADTPPPPPPTPPPPPPATHSDTQTVAVPTPPHTNMDVTAPPHPADCPRTPTGRALTTGGGSLTVAVSPPPHNAPVLPEPSPALSSHRSFFTAGGESGLGGWEGEGAGGGQLVPVPTPTPAPEAETPMDTSQGSGVPCGAVLVTPLEPAILPPPPPQTLPPPPQTPAPLPLPLEPFDISFDSPFIELMPDFVTEPPAGDTTRPPPVTPNGHCPRQPQPADPRPKATVDPLPFSPGPPTPTLAPAGSPRGNIVHRHGPTITDFSPEWSYPEGGVKVLITGPWSDDSHGFSCVFDRIAVPGKLIQPGVLRCYCPAHAAGVVRLHVSSQSPPALLSHSVLFEYRARHCPAQTSGQLDWLSLDDGQFRMSIVERLEQMERRMAEMAAANQQCPQRPPPRGHTQTSADTFEARVAALCRVMMGGPCWLRSDRLTHGVGTRGMTLLHLAAAQGYTRLIRTLIRWRSLNADSLDLEQEVDPLNVDHFSCTPLMWACALGHAETALLLCGWNCRALHIPDSLGRLPLHVARCRGHWRLAARLEELHGGRVVGGAGHSPNAAPHTHPHTPPHTHPHTDGILVPCHCAPPSPPGATELPQTPSPAPPSPSPHPPSPVPGEPAVAMEMGEVQRGAVLSRDPPWRRGQSGGAKSAATARRPGNTGPRFPPATAGPAGRDPMDTGPPPFNEDAENQGLLAPVHTLQVDMMVLAEQIIEATPDRIKHEDFAAVEGALRDTAASNTMSWLATYLENAEQTASFTGHRPACVQPVTPPAHACVSPVSSRPAHACVSPVSSPPAHACVSPVSSPLSDITFERVDGTANTDWSDFLNASANGKMEREFALLTLSDQEQHELYEAARIIQTAFRKYKGRRLKEQQELAAAVIQRCYRKYKQYALYKKMTQAAILIQSKFRSYYEQKRFQQSRRAAMLIQQYYRSYKGHRGGGSQQRRRASFLTKRQDQAARKIMRFLRRCRHRMKELRETQEMDAVKIRGLTT